MVSASDSFRRDLLQGLYRLSWRRSTSAWRSLFSPAQSDLLLATPYLALSSAAWKMGRFGLGGKVVRRKKKKKNSPGNRLETPSLPPSLPSSHPPSCSLRPPAHPPPPHPPALPTSSSSTPYQHSPLQRDSFSPFISQATSPPCQICVRVSVRVCACVCMCVCVSFVCAAPGRLFPFRVEKVQSTASKFGRQLQIGRPSSKRMQDSVTWRQLCPDWGR